MYENLQEQIKRELDRLNGTLSKVTKNKEEADTKYKLVLQDKNNKETKVCEIEESKRAMETKSYNSANRFRDLRLIVLASIYAILWAVVFMLLAFNVPSFLSNDTTLIIFAFISFGGCLLPAVANEKIKAKLIKKHTKKLENSEEYKELVNQLTQEKANLEKLGQKVERKEKILKWYANVEKDLINRRNTKKSFLSYLENQTMPKSTTIYKNKGRKFKNI